MNKAMKYNGFGDKIKNTEVGQPVSGTSDPQPGNMAVIWLMLAQF